MEESNRVLNDSPEAPLGMGFWDKIGLLALGTTLVSITLCLVACVVGRGCFLFNRIHKRTPKETEDEMFEAMKKKQMKFHEQIKQHREQRPGTVAHGDGTSTKQGIVFGYGSHGATSSQARFYAGQGTLPILEELENTMEETSVCPARLHDVQSAELSSDECTNCAEEGKGQTESLIRKKRGNSSDSTGKNGGNLSKLATVQQVPSHHVRGMVNKGRTEMPQRGGNPTAPPHLKAMPFQADGEEADEQTVLNVREAARKSTESDAITASDACVQSDECTQRKGEPPVAENTENEGKQKQSSFDSASSMSISSALSTLSLSLPSALSKKPRSGSVESENQSPSHMEERKQSTKSDKMITFSSLPSPPPSAGTVSSDGKCFSSASLTSSRSASTTSTSVVEMPNINLSFHLIKKVPERFCLNKDDRKESQTSLDERGIPKDDDSKESSPRTPRAEDENAGLLTMKIENVVGLPARDYSPSRNPFVRLVLVKDRRLLRRKSSNVLADFQTTVVKHELNPVFSQAFTTEIAMTEFKNIRLNIEVLDADRHTKITEICSTTIPLKEIKPLRSSEDPVQVNYHLTSKKQQFGKLFLGITYLPTAQRLSFNVVKASSLQYEEVVGSPEEFRPYVRILQINSVNGKVMKKKRTGVKTGTKDPQFDETLNFGMTPENLNNVVFLVLLSHRSVPEEQVDDDEASADSTSRTYGSSWPASADELLYATARELMIQKRNLKHSSKHDPCLGTVCLGPKVAEEKERMHWLSAMMTPRKAFSMWQTFY